MASLISMSPRLAADADLILHNGKVVTVDAAFRVVEAIAVKSGRITATGTSADILKGERSPRTKVVDLGGKTVLPGLIDAHVHALEAGLSEYRAPLPALDSITAIQDYIRTAARVPTQGRMDRGAANPAAAAQGDALPDASRTLTSSPTTPWRSTAATSGVRTRWRSR